MRQRMINWAGAMRDMRSRPDPRQQLIDEMVEVLTRCRSVLITAYHDIEDETARAVIQRRINSINSVLAKVEARQCK
jgi:uncharacterized protein YutE (UPF0331/DUF86 family)